MELYTTNQPTLTPAHGLAMSAHEVECLRQAARLRQTRTRPRKEGRRIRTAYSKPIEFVRTCDTLWAAILAAVFCAPLCWLLSPGLLGGGLLYLGLFAALWLVLWMSLINCNPYVPGFTVFDSFRTISRALPTHAVDHSTDLTALEYPCIFKPAKCSTNSSQVRLISSAAEARAHLIETEEEVVCAQRFHPGEEYTIMWERWPWRSQGQVIEMYWRKKTHPRGEFFPLSGGGTPKENVLVTRLYSAALRRAVEQMMEGMPDVYCTRFDVRARNHVELQKGNFWVMESNGTVGVPGEGLYNTIMRHWPRRMITGLYNMLFHPNARLHPRVLLERLRAFYRCGGWDFKICDGY